MAHVQLDPARDGELIEALRRRGYDVRPDPPAGDRPFLTLRNAFLAWLAYYTVRNPSWPLWALFWLVGVPLFTIVVGLLMGAAVEGGR